MKRTFYIDDLNKTVNFMFDYDTELIQDIKACDYNTRFNPVFKQWIVPINEWSVNRVKYIINNNDFIQVDKPKEEEVNVSYERSALDTAYVSGLCDSKDFAYKARDYQLECLAYSREKGNVLNGDDVGLGKTFESIIYTEVENAFPCLVIVPASVKYNWKEKWEEITKGKRDVAVIESKETKKHKNNWDADVVIINYDIIGKKQGKGATVKFNELVDIDWSMLIFDEGHFLKNKKAQRSKAALKISKNMDGIIQILTGTAITSKPVELWNLLVILKKEHLIANDWFNFVHRYCGAYLGKFGLVTDGATNVMELNRKLRESCYIRREKEDVLGELPEMIEQILQMSITNKRTIDKAKDNFIEYIMETKGEDAADKAMAAEHLVALNELRKLAIEGKLKAIEQWLKDWKECYPDEKVVIFGVHREPLQTLADKFKSPIINGGISSIKKQQIVKEFQKSNDLFLFANIAAAGTGVDGLQLVSSNMLIIELPWLTSDLTQVKGRLHRSGQTKPPNVYYMLNYETIDAEMWSMLEDKERVTEAVNKGIDVKKQGSGMRAVIKKLLKNNK